MGYGHKLCGSGFLGGSWKIQCPFCHVPRNLEGSGIVRDASVKSTPCLDGVGGEL
jgi:hypothetical protein